MADKMMSTSMTRGDHTAEHHNRREYEPENVEHTLTDRNVAFVDCGDLKDAVNAEFAPDIAAYNKKQRRKDRKKSTDYYQSVMDSGNDDVPVIEYTIGFGNRDVCGVCDDDFDRDEWHRLKDEDRENGTQTAGEYVRAHLSSGEKGEAHDAARQMCIDLAHKLMAGEGCPDGMKIMGLWLHDDEPNGTPHLHMAFTPIGVGYKTGLNRRVSIKKCFSAAGYTNEGTELLEWQRDVRKNLMEPIMAQYGYEREDMHNTERHLPVDEFKAKKRVEEAEAKLAETQAEAQAVTAEAEQKSAAADEKMSVVEQKSAEADKKTRKVVEDRVAVDRDRAKLAIERDGYTPPKDVIPMTPEPDIDSMGMPAPVREAWERWKAEPSAANGDAVKAAVESSVPVAKGRRAAINREGIYLVREEDVENFRRAWAADVDPMASHGGIAERERAVAAGERALNEREAAVKQSEEELEPKRCAVKDREDAVSDREDAADRRDKALDARENAVKADANGNAATKRALDRRKKELDEQADAQKDARQKLDERETKLDAREREIETSEADAQGIRDRANVYARLRVEQADEAAGETRFERLRKNPLKVFAHQLATLSDGLYAGGHSVAGRLASELGDVLDRMGEGFGRRLNDLLRRGLDEALMPEPTGADVAIEQMAHRDAPVQPANAQAWAAAGRYTDADAHVEGLDPDEPYDPYAIRDDGRDDDTIEYYG